MAVLLKTVLPFLLHFNLLTLDGWKEYIDHLTESSIAGVIQWLPFILIMTLQSKNERVAIWTAFGVGCLIALIEYLHSTYKPIYASFYWLSWFNLLTFLGMGIAFEITQFDWHLIGAITVSSLLLATICSLLVRSPFTMQMSRPMLILKGLQDFVESPNFYKMNVFLTQIWLVIFGVMTASSWIASLLIDSLGSAGQLILGTIVPIAFPVAGILLMPFFGNVWKKRNISANSGGSNSGQEKKEDIEINNGQEKKDDVDV